MAPHDHPRLYLGVDVGTTGTKAMVVDAAGQTHGHGRGTYSLRSPRPGQFIQDATEWRDGVTTAVQAACADLEPHRIAALAVSAQGGTLVAVDESHRPLTAARSWLDRRATSSAETFERVFGRDDFYRRTGWPIAPNNTAAQLSDLASTEPERFAAAACFCDTAAYLNGWLTGTPTVDTNVAGITQLLNVSTATWDGEILDAIGIDPARLPRLAMPGSAIGTLTDHAATALGLRPGTVVGAGAHDQYCAALGAGAINDGDVLLSTGTAWVMLAVAGGPYHDPTTGIGSGRHLIPGRWGHFGEVPSGGVSIEWARRLLTHGHHPPMALSGLDAVLAATRAGAAGLRFFPYFDGTSPYDDLKTSRGSLLGLDLGHDHRHMLRAVVEGVAFAVRILLEGYSQSAASPVGTPVVVGGATHSGEWIQMLADILSSDLRVSSIPDAACVGAAILAALAVDDVPNASIGAEHMTCPSATVAPQPSKARLYDRLFRAYQRNARALSELYADPHTRQERD